MSKILIVEDQVLIANHIKEILIEVYDFQVELAFKISQASEKLQKFIPDIILLDINLGDKMSGIEWAQENVKKEKVIFITGQTEIETIKSALTIHPIAYLTKPIKSVDLIAAIELAQELLKSKSIIIKDGYNEVKLNFDEILFIKSDKNYIDIQLSNRKITIRNTLENISKQLPEEVFMKVHRSYVINKNKILVKSTNTIQIESFEIPISRNLVVGL